MRYINEIDLETTSCNLGPLSCWNSLERLRNDKWGYASIWVWVSGMDVNRSNIIKLFLNIKQIYEYYSLISGHLTDMHVIQLYLNIWQIRIHNRIFNAHKLFCNMWWTFYLEEHKNIGLKCSSGFFFYSGYPF
jgi:hypothetical protein